MREISLFILKAYKLFVSPVLVSLFGHGCKYEVTCSQYAIEMISKKGFISGGRLSFKRFLSCNNY